LQSPKRENARTKRQDFAQSHEGARKTDSGEGRLKTAEQRTNEWFLAKPGEEYCCRPQISEYLAGHILTQQSKVFAQVETVAQLCDCELAVADFTRLRRGAQPSGQCVLAVSAASKV